MKAYQGGSYQDRVQRAAEAKQKALDLLKAKPAVDEATLATRRDAALARETQQAAKRAARLAEREEAAAQKARRAEEKTVPVATDEERKAMRDARYAARKSRK